MQNRCLSSDEALIALMTRSDRGQRRRGAARGGPRGGAGAVDAAVPQTRPAGARQDDRADESLRARPRRRRRDRRRVGRHSTGCACRRSDDGDRRADERPPAAAPRSRVPAQAGRRTRLPARSQDAESQGDPMLASNFFSFMACPPKSGRAARPYASAGTRAIRLPATTAKIGRQARSRPSKNRHGCGRFLSRTHTFTPGTAPSCRHDNCGLVAGGATSVLPVARRNTG